jgi:hypothetical protein
VKRGKQKGGQALSERVDEDMRHVLRAGAELKHGKNLRQGINGQPQPKDPFGAAQPGSQFIQLEMREPETGEEALVQGLCMLSSASEPGSDGGLTVAEHALSCGRIQPFGQRREHHGDLVRGSFQAVQGSGAPGSEGGAASLTAKGLDALGTAMLAIPNQRVDPIICDAEVQALLVWTGEAHGLYPLGGSSAAFHLTPGPYWCWRRFHHGQVGAGEAAVGAVKWGAWLKQTLGCGVDGPTS